MKKTLPYLFLLLMGLTNCAPSPTFEELTLNGLDFSNYIAVGSEYTAGYSNDGLYSDAQKNSYPALISQQVRHIHNIPFNQPYLETGNDSHYFLHKIEPNKNCPNTSSFFDFDTTTYLPGSLWEGIWQKAPFHNIGIPFLRTVDIEKDYVTMPNFIGENQYLRRLLPSPMSYLDYIKSQQTAPSFFTLEMGFNDVFWYVWNGGQENSSIKISEQAAFEEKYEKLLNVLMKNGTKGVLITIPSVTDLPYVTVSGNNWIDNLTCKNVTLYEIIDSTGEVHRLTQGDYLLLPAYTMKLHSPSLPWGTNPDYPLEQRHILDKIEIEKARNAVQNFNAFIRKKADENNLALFDMEKLTKDLRTGTMMLDGLNISDKYIYGEFYSLDGWSLTSRGNAVVANQIIQVINAKYKSSIPLLNVEEYEGTVFPQRYGNQSCDDCINSNELQYKN